MIKSIIGTLIALMIVWLWREIVMFYKFEKGFIIKNDQKAIDVTLWQLYLLKPFHKRVRAYIGWRHDGHLSLN